MGNYYLLDSAAADLARIRNYFLRRGREQAGIRLIARIRDICELLADQPYMGVGRPYEPGMRGYVVPRTGYIVLYFPDRSPIEIARVIHGSQDLEMLFGQSS